MAADHRLGDIIDDYCSRCRLLTNHSVAAIVDGEVKKVICRTCQHAHDYKHGKGGEKKKPKPSAYDQVLASVLAGRSVEEPSASKAQRPTRSPGRSRMPNSGRGRRSPQR